MVTTNRSDLWDRMWSLKDHGKSYTEVHRENHSQGYKWLHDTFGSNFRLTEFQGAIGRVQLSKLNQWRDIRKRNAMILFNLLSTLNCVRIPLPSPPYTHAWYKFYAYIKNDCLTEEWSRDRIISEINALGYPAYTGSCSEIYLETCFQKAGLSPVDRLPTARKLGDTSLMFLVHPTINVEEMNRYANAIYLVLKKACK